MSCSSLARHSASRFAIAAWRSRSSSSACTWPEALVEASSEPVDADTSIGVHCGDNSTSQTHLARLREPKHPQHQSLGGMQHRVPHCERNTKLPTQASSGGPTWGTGCLPGLRQGCLAWQVSCVMQSYCSAVYIGDLLITAVQGCAPVPDSSWAGACV